MTPAGTAAFWLVAGAFAAMVMVQVIFWTKTQPANSFWLEETELSRSATRFFQTGQRSAPRDWAAARDQWERSHIRHRRRSADGEGRPYLAHGAN
jgi:hypothetical protein